jgi:hypothetical protein
MKRILPLLFFVSLTTFGLYAQADNIAKLDFPLPAQAKYTVTTNQFNKAKDLLKQKLGADTNQLAELISFPSMCGPGLWQSLKASPHFSIPPRAKTTCKIPLAGGKFKELPAALLQNETEATNFRLALADLLAKNGDLKFRLPTKEEFRAYWAVIPFDDISEPLIVAEGRNYNLIILFTKGKPFWLDETKTLLEK